MNAVRKIPARKCVGCKEMKPKKELIRVLRTPDGQILFDENGKMNGRGAYVCRNAGCMEKALRNRELERSLSVKIPEEVVERLRKEMEELGS